MLRASKIIPGVYSLSAIPSPRGVSSISKSAGRQFSRHLFLWRFAQDAMLCTGIALVGALLLYPKLGLDLLWNGLIPAAPVLLVLFPGVWRNVCPLASFALLPQRFGWYMQRPMPQGLAPLLSLFGLAALLLIVPYRHVSLDRSASASALMLLLSGALALLAGLLFGARSAWCNSLCPIHPAEKLYGSAPVWTPTNARCLSCSKCSRPCPDSTRALNPTVTGPSRLERGVGHVMTGGFAGFIWGWYQVGDLLLPYTQFDVFVAYAWPFAGGLFSLALYGLIYRRFAAEAVLRRRMVTVFAWAAVTLYYWYRLPELMGFGGHQETGMLVDWRAHGDWLPWSARFLSTSFLIWFMLLRSAQAQPWMHRTQNAIAGGVLPPAIER